MFFRRHDPVADRLGALGLNPFPAQRLSQSGTLLDLPAGTRLCTQGERGTQAFLLLEGRAEVRLEGTTVEVGPGAVIGELATLDGKRPRNATVEAAEPVALLVFDAATFRSLAEDPELRPLLLPERTAA
jgi:CRP-like cAMP-binding protein